MFQHTAARRRLAHYVGLIIRSDTVSTHSRPKAAGIQTVQRPLRHVRFNTQPPEGGWLELHNRDIVIPHVSTHSRPKAAGRRGKHWTSGSKFQHTAARRRLGDRRLGVVSLLWFQHTAARRRLGFLIVICGMMIGFQHTAARRRLAPVVGVSSPEHCFNTQPPEGGWQYQQLQQQYQQLFQHTAARRRLDCPCAAVLLRFEFQHTAARRRLEQHCA